MYTLYPNDPAQGSPFGTGDEDQLSPQYKRMSAIQGDLVFQAPRRFFVDTVSSKQPTWFFSTSASATTIIGTAADANADEFLGSERGPFKGLGYVSAYIVRESRERLT